jgi:NAD(P)-dependent dehydrogenase (short-subunit alcohol dehydrogenase family)
LIANLALEVAPVRVNLIAPGFVDTPLSAELLGDRPGVKAISMRVVVALVQSWRKTT